MNKLLLMTVGVALALAGCAGEPEGEATNDGRGTGGTGPGAGDGTGGAGTGGAGDATTTTTPAQTGGDADGGDDAPFEVVSATREDGGCLFASGDGSCHVLQVHVDNTGSTRDFSANMFYWSAVTEDGQVFDVPDVEGADAIAGGSEGDLTLKFDVDGDAKLAQLRYETFGQDRIIVDIPEY